MSVILMLVLILPGDPPKAGANISAVNGGELDRLTLLNLTRQVVDAVQLGTLGDALNLTILGIDVQEPLPAPESMFVQPFENKDVLVSRAWDL